MPIILYYRGQVPKKYDYLLRLHKKRKNIMLVLKLTSFLFTPVGNSDNNVPWGPIDFSHNLFIISFDIIFVV